MKITRHFVTVEGREVHYLRTGSGPPALFIHSSPTNSSFVVEDMLALAESHTCFAFDTPGFGLSDPLPGDLLTMADLAGATASAIDALGIAPLPVYGTHTGAAIALELGYRYPAKVTGLFLDGVPIFTREEIAPLGDNYFAPLVVDPLGGHFAATWTRFRDQSIWFPWCFREPANLNEYDLLPPENLHRWLQMFFAAAPHYKAAYPAAVRYCEGAIEAAAALTVPAVYTASDTDMLFSHLERLPPLRANQHIVRFGTDSAIKHQMTADAFARFGSSGNVPDPGAPIADGSTVRRRFVDDDNRTQMIRHAGKTAAPVTLLLHDVPGSSFMLENRIAALAANAFVIAPDLPGSGESDGLGQDAEIDDYAKAMWRMLDLLDIGEVDIEAHGFAASLAVEMAASPRVRSVAIDGLFLPDDTERADLLAHYAPTITIDDDGAHWYRTWLMLRDGLVYWPWYKSKKTSLRREAVSFDAQQLHDRTVETMKKHAQYHHFIRAALRHNAAAALTTSLAPLTCMPTAYSPLAKAYGEQLEELTRSAIDGSLFRPLND